MPIPPRDVRELALDITPPPGVMNPTVSMNIEEFNGRKVVVFRVGDKKAWTETIVPDDHFLLLNDRKGTKAKDADDTWLKIDLRGKTVGMATGNALAEGKPNVTAEQVQKLAASTLMEAEITALNKKAAFNAALGRNSNALDALVRLHDAKLKPLDEKDPLYGLSKAINKQLAALQEKQDKQITKEQTDKRKPVYTIDITPPPLSDLQLPEKEAEAINPETGVKEPIWNLKGLQGKLSSEAGTEMKKDFMQAKPPRSAVTITADDDGNARLYVTRGQATIVHQYDFNPDALDDKADIHLKLGNKISANIPAAEWKNAKEGAQAAYIQNVLLAPEKLANPKMKVESFKDYNDAFKAPDKEDNASLHKKSADFATLIAQGPQPTAENNEIGEVGKLGKPAFALGLPNTSFGRTT